MPSDRPSVSDLLRQARIAFADYLGADVADDLMRAQLAVSRFTTAVAFLNQMQMQSFDEALDVYNLATKLANGVVDLKGDVAPEAQTAIETLVATALREGARVRSMATMVVSGMA